MAYLTKPTQYNIEDSNIALLGSDVCPERSGVVSSDAILNSSRSISAKTQVTRRPPGNEQGPHLVFKSGVWNSSVLSNGQKTVTEYFMAGTPTSFSM